MTTCRVATILAALGVAAVVSSCSSQSSDASSTTTTPTAEVTSTTLTVTTTVQPTTTTPPTTSTAAPTTTTAPSPPPAAIAGLTVAIGAGSQEVSVEWDRGSEPDLNRYNLWYSLLPGGSKTLLASVNHEVSEITPPAFDVGSGRTRYEDWPRDQDQNTECYQVSAVDSSDTEGDRSVEVCLPAIPPGMVSWFQVGIGGGSGEVFLRWTRGPEPDLDHYNLWYTEFPGQPNTLLDSVAHDPGSLTSPAYSYDGTTTAYVDFPKNLANDTQCYQISAVDTTGFESQRTPEQCLSGL